MAYDKFEILKSTGVPLNIDNVDTDQIIPARFLKATERKGFGDNLFRDWRHPRAVYPSWHRDDYCKSKMATSHRLAGLELRIDRKPQNLEVG